MVFEDIIIFSSDRFRTSIWDPPGLFLGGYLTPKMAETSLQGALGPAKGRFQLLFFGLGGFQERSKSVPRDLQETPRLPRQLQEALGSILEPFWSNYRVHFRMVLEPS